MKKTLASSTSRWRFAALSDFSLYFNGKKCIFETPFSQKNKYIASYIVSIPVIIILGETTRKDTAFSAILPKQV